MNGPFLLVRATYGFARFGYSVLVRLLGPRAKPLLAAGFALGTIVAIYLQLTH